MGHRKHSQPRRGSLGYLPRGRAKSMEARIRSWPEITSEQPKLLGY
ncbi:MAG: 50S ribosomal protein L3, partial [Candidatus Nitrosotenuis sp.]|nr:50S ribosomal protein L3 [Candidatus Nitrosotenuis sp.]